VNWFGQILRARKCNILIATLGSHALPHMYSSLRYNYYMYSMSELMITFGHQTKCDQITQINVQKLCNFLDTLFFQKTRRPKGWTAMPINIISSDVCTYVFTRFIFYTHQFSMAQMQLVSSPVFLPMLYKTTVSHCHPWWLGS